MSVDFVPKDRYDFDDLVRIVEILRGENGCPWDREQDHHSIRRDFLEETYEALEAIDTEDRVLLQEELGDVLLQVVFHAEIERENHSFDIGDVCNDICKKMILRHPHVFGDTVAETTEKVLSNWEEIKQKEKGQTTKTQTLLSVPRTFPALMRARKLQSRSQKAGVDVNKLFSPGQTADDAMAQLKAAMERQDAAAVDHALGDLMFSLVSVARDYDLDPEFSLSRKCDCFLRQFAVMEELAQQQKVEMKDASETVLAALWKQAGEKTGNELSLNHRE